MVRTYLLGERGVMTDLNAWNADATRMPYRQHAEYLWRLFLDNDPAEGRFPAAGKPVALTDIRAPIFGVGRETDHVAPWRSVYKLHLLTDTGITFLLTSGGHNAGIVVRTREPRVGTVGWPRRGRRLSIWIGTDPDGWLSTALMKEGSWCPEWISWLEARSGEPTRPPAMGAEGYEPLCEAPGSYVPAQ